MVKTPPLPEPPKGENPFQWIVRMAPIVRAQRQAAFDEARRAMRIAGRVGLQRAA